MRQELARMSLLLYAQFHFCSIIIWYTWLTLIGTCSIPERRASCVCMLCELVLFRKSEPEGDSQCLDVLCVCLVWHTQTCVIQSEEDSWYLLHCSLQVLHTKYFHAGWPLGSLMWSTIRRCKRHKKEISGSRSFNLSACKSEMGPWLRYLSYS